MYIGFLWLWLLSPPLGAANPEGGSLIVHRSGIDFGDVTARSQNDTWLRLQNTTNRRIRIIADNADCNCLTNRLSRSDLSPNDLLDWNIRLNTCDYTGEVRRHVWIETDDPLLPLLRLPVRYRVLPEVYTDPEFVPLGLVDNGDVDVEVAIHTTSELPLHLFHPYATDPRINVRVMQPLVSAEAPASMRIHISGGFTAESFSAECFVDTTAPDIERIRVPVLGEGATGIHCSLRELDLESLPLGVGGEKNVRLTLDPGTEITSARITDAGIDVTKLARFEGGVTVTVASAASLPLGNFRGWLNLETRGPGGRRSVRFPYRGRVVERIVAVPRESVPIQRAPIADLVGVPLP